MHTQRIRPIAICVFSNDGRILVIEGYDSAKRQSFFRPIGGGIEFGETGVQAVVREVREEIGAEIKNLRLLGTLENIFTYLDKPGHEIVQVYDAEFLEPSLYLQTFIPGAEDDGNPFQAVWRDLNSFSSRAPLYPDGLLPLLQAAK